MRERERERERDEDKDYLCCVVLCCDVVCVGGGRVRLEYNRG